METPIPFDPEQFRSDLAEKTEKYAAAAYGGARETTEIATALYQELLDDCADALLTATDKEATMRIIKNTLVSYRYKNGPVWLFGGSAETTFYHDLALRLSNKAIK